MGEEDGVVHETLQEQRERERELLTPKGATTGLELKELLALVAISVVVVVVTLVLML